ncbi:MAG: hypothetical protein GY946_16595, partial [bacterium]|nr:hypothetical protein [bacterium]
MSGEERQPEGNAVPPHQLATWTVLGLAIIVIGVLFGVQTEHQPDTSRPYPSRALIP